MRLTISLPNEKVFIKDYDAPVVVEDLVKEYQSEADHTIVACRVKYRNAHFLEEINEDCEVDLLDMQNPYGNMAYQASLTLLYLTAIRDVVGENTKVTIANSLSKGVFTKIKTGNITDELAATIEKRMKELVEADLPISERRIEKEEILTFLEGFGSSEELRLFKSADDLRHAFLCDLNGSQSLFYVHVVPRTSYIKLL